MKPFIRQILAIAIVLSMAPPSLFAARGTTGTPLGGLGASYIVYNGKKNIFVKGYRLTGQHWYQEVKFPASFNLYTKVNNTVKTFMGMKSEDEDALIPIYKVNYGDANNKIDVKLLAFGPYVTGDEQSSVMPLAFFEFTLKNNNPTAAEAAIAFQVSDLAGINPQIIPGVNGVHWSKSPTSKDNSTSALAASSDKLDAQITTGVSLDEFKKSGTLGNTHGGAVAIKLNLGPSDSGKIRFVLGWYQDFKDLNCRGVTVDEGFYYMNYIKNSIEAVQYGLTEFIRIRDGASGFTNRIMGIPELPLWYKDRLLNNLYPLTHNSQYTRDGRFAWREGKYFIIGTIDQQGHSQIATSYNWPEGQWRQMLYWGKTQRQGVLLGQIHHDFNGPKSGADKINAMCDWDDHDHIDYWWSKTENWSDLNSLFIINIYELFLATGDMKWLDSLWNPYVMNTARRILRQATHCIDNQFIAPPAPNYVLPHQCLGSYDREGATNEYNGSLALVAYSALAEMCRAREDKNGAAEWDSIFALGKKQFSKQYSSTLSFGSTVEGELGVYNFSRHLGLPVIMSDDEANKAFDRYWNKSIQGRDLLPWHFYTINHFGDLGIAIGKVDEGLFVHFNDYEQNCVRNPTYYFWQDLDASPGMHSYMTAPVVWRSYLLITGFVMDKFNQRLWLRPMLPVDSLHSNKKGKLTNAPLISPGNWGTLDYEETENGRDQKLKVKFDSSMIVKEIRLKNPSQRKDHKIAIGGAGTGFKVEYLGEGLDAQIKIIFDSPVTIDTNGIEIGVNMHVSTRQAKNGKFSNSLSVRTYNKMQVINCSIEKKGNVKLAVYMANGVQVRNLDLGTRAAGNFSYTFSNLSSGFYYVRLIHDGKYLSTASMVVTK